MYDQARYYYDKLHYETDPWDLFTDLEKGEHIVVIDARTPEAFAQAHIPGAVNIPHRTMDQSATAHLDREVLYVVYCDGIGCNASTKGALNMASLGFRVKELIGGLEWWIKDGFVTEGTIPTPGKTLPCGCG